MSLHSIKNTKIYIQTSESGVYPNLNTNIIYILSLFSQILPVLLLRQKQNLQSNGFIELVPGKTIECVSQEEFSGEKKQEQLNLFVFHGLIQKMYIH